MPATSRNSRALTPSGGSFSVQDPESGDGAIRQRPHRTSSDEKATPGERKYYPIVIFCIFLASLALAIGVGAKDGLSETIFASIHSPWVAAISWLFIIARMISYWSYLARLKDYKRQLMEWKLTLLSVIATPILAALMIFVWPVKHFFFGPLLDIGSGILSSFFLTSQLVGLLPRIFRVFDIKQDGDKEKAKAICLSKWQRINYNNEHLAITFAFAGSIIFIVVCAAMGTLSLFSGGAAALMGICTIWALTGMVVSSASYIGRALDILSTFTFADLFSKVVNANEKGEKRALNGESIGMLVGMPVWVGLGLALVFAAGISIPFTAPFGFGFAVFIFTFGNIGVGGAFGARVGNCFMWLRDCLFGSPNTPSAPDAPTAALIGPNSLGGGEYGSTDGHASTTSSRPSSANPGQSGRTSRTNNRGFPFPQGSISPAPDDAAHQLSDDVASVTFATKSHTEPTPAVQTFTEVLRKTQPPMAAATQAVLVDTHQAPQRSEGKTSAFLADGVTKSQPTQWGEKAAAAKPTSAIGWYSPFEASKTEARTPASARSSQPKHDEKTSSFISAEQPSQYSDTVKSLYASCYNPGLVAA